MRDRIPLYPGRVTLTPVAGQENTYDMKRADQPTQEGTPLNKGTLLSDETASKFFESLVGTETVDQVLRKLCDSPLHVGDLRESLRTDLQDPWVLCNGDQFYAADYPELATLCVETPTKYAKIADIGDIIRQMAPDYPFIWRIYYNEPKSQWIVYARNDSGSTNGINMNCIVFGSFDGPYEAHPITLDGVSMNRDINDMVYCNGQFAFHNGNVIDSAPTFYYSNDGYTFQAIQLGTKLASSYMYWTFCRVVANKNYFFELCYYRYSDGYQGRVFSGTTIEDLVNASKFITFSNNNQSLSYSSAANDLLCNPPQYLFISTSAYSSQMGGIVLNPGGAFTRLTEIKYQAAGSDTTANLYLFNLRKIGNYFFVSGRSNSSSSTEYFGYCDTVTGTYQECPMAKAFNTIAFEYDDVNNIYFHYSGYAPVSIGIAKELTDTTLISGAIFDKAISATQYVTVIFDYNNKPLLIVRGEVIQNPIDKLMSPILPTISTDTHYIYVKARER